jgi:hypothetical protein
MSDFSPLDDKPRTRRERHIVRVRAGPELDEEIEGETDLLDRVAIPHFLRAIKRDPRRKEDVASLLRSVQGSKADPDLGVALVVGLRACQLKADPHHRIAAHRERQNAFRKSSDPRIALERHEYTAHAAGQLEALLALGYCRRLNMPGISARLLRPLARGVTLAIWRGPIRTGASTELEEEFRSWVDKVRSRVKRMRRNLGPDDLNTRADAAIERVVVFLQTL